MAAVETVLDVLEANSFRRLPKPLLVGGTAFDFDAAATGTDRSHDLVIVSGPRIRAARLGRLVQGLNRALDSQRSRRPVSLVLVAPSLDPSERNELEAQARILTISREEPTEDEVRDAISVLLPLRLPQPRTTNADPLGEVVTGLGIDISDEHRVLIEAARAGQENVQEVLRSFIDAAARDGEDGGSDK